METTMLNTLKTLTLITVLGAIASPALAEPKVGAPAPAFTAIDAAGKTRTLSEFAGKTVVLEWTNDGCPFVQKHYGAGNMQALQKRFTAEGIVWLSVISSAPGEQGYATPDKANMLTAERGAAPTAVLLDPKGVVGKAYGAQTTPHMYVIDKTGVLTYMGAIDDKPSANKSDIATAKNYVVAALTETLGGKPVSQPATKAYGCTVKYAS
jgi:peroxiredoxin